MNVHTTLYLTLQNVLWGPGVAIFNGNRNQFLRISLKGLDNSTCDGDNMNVRGGPGGGLLIPSK